MTIRLALIPARGGSKRIPRKNVRIFAGKPMISWPIEAARESGLFDRIIVSTDDDEVAEITRTAGAEVPFMRPAELSDDHTPIRPVIRHAVEAVEADGQRVSTICNIYATSPFVMPSDLAAGLEAVSAEGVNFAFAAAVYPHPIQRAFHLTPSGGVEMADLEMSRVRTQDLTEHYHDAGMFCWGTREGFFSETPMFSEEARMVRIPATRVHDIDEPEDWARAELAFEILKARAS